MLSGEFRPAREDIAPDRFHPRQRDFRSVEELLRVNAVLRQAAAVIRGDHFGEQRAVDLEMELQAVKNPVEAEELVRREVGGREMDRTRRQRERVAVPVYRAEWP